jgi:hypothetical protein
MFIGRRCGWSLSCTAVVSMTCNVPSLLRLGGQDMDLPDIPDAQADEVEQAVRKTPLSSIKSVKHLSMGCEFVIDVCHKHAL